MPYRIITGEMMDRDVLKQVMEIDTIVYAEDGYVGIYENLAARFDVEARQFVCAMDAENGRMAGYINFLPCSEELYQDIRYQTEIIRDDDIMPSELIPLQKGRNHLFIISIATHPDYRDSGVIKELSAAWIDYLNQLQAEGYEISDITAAAVSPDGKKALHRMRFVQERVLMEDGNVSFVCEGENLQLLLAGELDFSPVRNYENDIYLMIPLAENPRNWRLKEQKIFEKARAYAKNHYEDVPNDFAAKLLDMLDEELHYECKNAVVSEMDIAYLGEYEFLHSTDNYPEPHEEPEIVGFEKCQLILTCHEKTHLYVLTVILPLSQYPTTQILDQLSHESIWIRTPGDASQYLVDGRKWDVEPEDQPEPDLPDYMDLYLYLKRRYGLLKCGPAKAFVLLSDRPENEVEFGCMMAGETFVSKHQNFHIKSEHLKEICSKNYAQYDYYEVYLSEMVVACIMKDFDGNDVISSMEDRIQLTSTYAFIVIMVMFQNTSIVKVNMQITNALANDGDISHDQILSLYRGFGRTVRFWETNNYKYWGTQQEASCIMEAFGNKELKDTYYEHQEYLEHIVELKSAKSEERNGIILNVVAMILAIIQVQGFVVGLLGKFYGNIGISVAYAETTFSTLVIGGALSFVLVLIIIQRMRAKLRRGSMHIKELQEDAVTDELWKNSRKGEER